MHGCIHLHSPTQRNGNINSKRRERRVILFISSARWTRRFRISISIGELLCCCCCCWRCFLLFVADLFMIILLLIFFYLTRRVMLPLHKIRAWFSTKANSMHKQAPIYFCSPCSICFVLLRWEWEGTFFEAHKPHGLSLCHAYYFFFPSSSSIVFAYLLQCPSISLRIFNHAKKEKNQIASPAFIVIVQFDGIDTARGALGISELFNLSYDLMNAKGREVKVRLKQRGRGMRQEAEKRRKEGRGN